MTGKLTNSVNKLNKLNLHESRLDEEADENLFVSDTLDS